MLDGVMSTDVGIHVKVFPPLVIPKRHGVKADVTGEQPAHMWHGAYGYDEMMLPVEVYIDGNAARETVAAFLRPEVREIIFGDDPGYKLVGRCDDQIDLEKIMRGRLPRTATINYMCSPFKQLAWPGDALEVTAYTVLEHPGTARSTPKMTVWGSGDGVIVLRSKEEFVIHGLEEGKPMVIDSGAMICTDEEGEEDRSADTEGDYPVLEPGENSISLSGGITKVVIEPRWAWLGR